MKEQQDHGNSRNKDYGISGSSRNHGSYDQDCPSRVSQPTYDSQAAHDSRSRPCRASQPTHDSQNSQSSQNSHGFPPPPSLRSTTGSILTPRGDYHNLLSFAKAEVVYDITWRFARKYLPHGDRTIDQMIQSARSGKKNILEGSKASSTSKETEIKLTNVARASLEEVLDDYVDYLRVRDLVIWNKDSRQSRYVRRLGRQVPQTFELYREFVKTRPPEVVANIAICLIHQANYLVDRQLVRLEREFLAQGGLRERMTKLRQQARESSSARSRAK